VLVHVEAGAGDDAAPEGVDERTLVDERAAGGVDEVAVGPDAFERSGSMRWCVSGAEATWSETKRDRSRSSSKPA
jgi:hypothetical protein